MHSVFQPNYTPGILTYNSNDHSLFLCETALSILELQDTPNDGIDLINSLFANQTETDFNDVLNDVRSKNKATSHTLQLPNGLEVIFNIKKGQNESIIGTIQYCTSESNSEKNFQFTEREFNRAFKYSAIGMALVSPEGKWLKVNKSLCNILGYTKSELIQLTFQDITHPQDIDLDINNVKKMLLGKIETYQMEKRYFHKNGDIIWVQLNVSLVWSEDRQPLYFISQIQDITKYKKTVADLKKEQLKLEGILEGTNLGTWEWHIPSGEIVLNTRCNEIVGFRPEELNAHHISVWEEMLHPDDYHRALQAHEECFTKKTTYLDVIYRLKHKSGEYIWIRDRGKVIEWSEDGNEAITISGTLADISAEVHREKEIVKDKDFLHSIVNALPDLLFRFDREYRFTYCHTNTPEKLVANPKDFLGKKTSDIFPENFSDMIKNYLDKTFDSNEIEFLEYDIELPDGINYFEARAIKLYDEEVLVIIRDITQRKQSEILLKQNENQLKSIISAMQEGIVMHAEDGSIIQCNQSAEKILGLTNSQIIGKKPIDPLWKTIRTDGSYFPGEEHPAMMSLKTGLSYTNVLMGIQKPNNELTWISINSEPLFNQGVDKPYASVTTFHDITEQKKAENKLRKLYELMALTGNDIDKNLTKVLEEGCKILDMELGIISKIKGNEYKVMYDYNQDGVKLKGEVFEFENTYCEITYRNNQLTAIEHMGKSTHNGHPCYQLFKLESYIGVPLTVNDKRYGTLNFSSSKIRKSIFASIDQDFLLLLAKWISSMIEMREAKEELEINEKKYRAFYELSPVGIVTHDLNNNLIQNYNDAFAKMLGYKNNELNNTYLDKIMDMSNEAEIKQKREELIATGTCGPCEMNFIHKDNYHIPVLLSSVIIFNGNGEESIFTILQDISERKRSEEKYRNVISGINIGMLEINNENEISFANDNFCEMSGYTSAELIGQKIYDFYINNKVSLVENTNNSNGDQIWIKNKKGDLRCWLTNNVPNYIREEQRIGVIGIYLDITEQKILEQELEVAITKAEESSKAKEVFLTNMSHEIRTPLNAIIGMNRALKKLPFDEIANSYLQNIDQASVHLLSIINNILDLSKIEAGEFQLDNRHFDLKHEIESTVNILKVKAREKELNLTTSLDFGNNTVFFGDNTVVRQILINLIGNAIKFTENGSIKVSCFNKKTNDNHYEIHLKITDTGIGMDEDYLASIFHKFSQEDKSIARKFGGTGLGMPITYELIQMLNGSIDVKSTKNVGTTVAIMLELAQGDQNSVLKESTNIDTRILLDKTILLVEDNEMNRLVANNTLSHYKSIIYEAGNGLEAIELIKKQHFDIILMDIQMPELDGIEATKIIRNELNISTPIIALTANAFKSEVEHCLSIGMTNYVTKPFEEEALIRVIITALEQTPTFDSAIIVKEKNTPLFNLEKLYNTSKGDTEFVKKMISLFYEQIPVAIEKIKYAFDTKEYAEIKSTAHRIKPTLDFLKIDSLHDTIRVLEQADQHSEEIIKQQVETLETTIVQVIENLKLIHP